MLCYVEELGLDLFVLIFSLVFVCIVSFFFFVKNNYIILDCYCWKGIFFLVFYFRDRKRKLKLEKWNFDNLIASLWLVLGYNLDIMIFRLAFFLVFVFFINSRS